jgi:hypothetical protein
MSGNPIDLVLARLDGFKLRENGRDRWRACCPAHGGNNPTALSVGVGDDGRVLLRCWHGCSVDAVAAALGLELGDLFPPRPEPAGGYAPMRRRRLLPAGQALELLASEATLVAVCVADVARGKTLDDTTKDRLLLAAARMLTIRDEVRS